MDKEKCIELCKKIHLNNSKMFFETEDFNKWVNECYKLYLENSTQKEMKNG